MKWKKGKEYVEEGESSLEQSAPAARRKQKLLDPREVQALLTESRMEGWYCFTWFKGQLFIAFHILQYPFEF